MNIRTPKKLTAGLAVTIGLLLMAGVAEAAWSTSGSGTATAKATTASALTAVTGSSATATLLYPGMTAGDLVMNVTNPNPFPVTIQSVTVGSTTPSSVSGGSGCTVANSGVTFANKTGLSLSVAANATAATVIVPGATTMSTSSDNGCQGASFSVSVNFTAVSA